MQLGDKVKYSATLSRVRVKHKRNWERGDFYPNPPREGVYIGTRTLWNGECDYDDYGITGFNPHNHFEAALVVFDPRCNPVLVPLDALEAPHAHP